jgi:hypothetical protein
MSALFSPIKLRGLALANRIMVAPMCQYSAAEGEANDWHCTHINTLALSGASIFCIEATAVEAIGRITPGCLGLWNDATEAALRPILASVRKHSKTAVIMQLAHAGRKASSHVPWGGGQQIPLSEGGWQAEGPSALPHKEGETPPLAFDSASTGWSCTARTAISCTSSCRRSQTSAPTDMAGPCKTGCVIRWKCSTRSARRFPNTSLSASRCPRPTGSRAAGILRKRSNLRAS